MAPRSKTAASPRAKTVEEYISFAPAGVQAKLRQFRKLLQSSAPEARETISYRLPFYYYRGARLAFGAFKTHIGFFGVAKAIAQFREELQPYSQTEKGTIHFALDRPLPTALIKRLVRARMQSADQHSSVRSSRQS